MNIVEELNKLAEKITGTNPNCTLDAEAVKYLQENTGNDELDVYFSDDFITRYFGDVSNLGEMIEITNENDIEIFEKIDEALTKNIKTKINLSINLVGLRLYLTPNDVQKQEDNFYGFQVILPDFSDDEIFSIYYEINDGVRTLTPNIYKLTREFE